MSAFSDSPTRRWWALGILAMTELVVVLDTMIVTIALPQAQADLGMSDAQRQWVGPAFAGAGATMIIAAIVAITIIRGKKNDLMPSWDAEAEWEEEKVSVH